MSAHVQLEKRLANRSDHSDHFCQIIKRWFTYYVQIKITNISYLVYTRRTKSSGKRREKEGNMLEVGHPVRDLKSPTGELHCGLLSWTAICHWPGCSVTPSAPGVLPLSMHVSLWTKRVRRGRQGPSAALAELTAICVAAIGCLL